MRKRTIFRPVDVDSVLERNRVPERIAYDPYGTHAADERQATDSDPELSAFQGGKIDIAAGYMHFDNREFNPTPMRWMDQDPADYVENLTAFPSVESSSAGESDSGGMI